MEGYDDGSEGALLGSCCFGGGVGRGKSCCFTCPILVPSYVNSTLQFNPYRGEHHFQIVHMLSLSPKGLNDERILYYHSDLLS
jgi:hypothetical protein